MSEQRLKEIEEQIVALRMERDDLKLVDIRRALRRQLEPMVRYVMESEDDKTFHIRMSMLEEKLRTEREDGMMAGHGMRTTRQQ